jgi:hypothetical protein
VPAVRRLIEPSAFQEFLRNTDGYRNRALAEVAEILDECYARTHAAETVGSVRAR